MTGCQSEAQQLIFNHLFKMYVFRQEHFAQNLGNHRWRKRAHMDQFLSLEIYIQSIKSVD